VESFEAFKDSFSYGSRTDLNFKCLKKLSADEAAEFLQLLLDEVGHTFDHGDPAEMHRLVYEWQVRAYGPDPAVPPAYGYDDAPFTPMAVPLAQARVGLLTSSGHFHDDDDPRPFGVEAMTQEEAAGRIAEFLRATPQLSRIHRDVAADRLRVRHGGYDVRSSARDHNVTLPRDALVEAQEEGRIGELADTMYSFVGATAQGRLRKEALPGWVDELHGAGLDALLLVPV
jgi:hypothetical protein